ncbi:hypothetical protein LSH36_540g00043 [Paralvinella palmiformis]|uniref:Uncharacterized protein n=1 Tax=Paralvinella palmiformis TaxID=53620 RepID=A0AAD9MXF1_9ANNE|nr:hypothetical protein LSH36_540g00043 [Paralvinella palmiformis]
MVSTRFRIMAMDYDFYHHHHHHHRMTLLTLILSFGVLGGTSVTYLRVGVVLGTDSDSPCAMQRSGAAIDLAVQRINDEILNSSYQIQTVKRTFSGGCNATMSTGRL